MTTFFQYLMGVKAKPIVTASTSTTEYNEKTPYETPIDSISRDLRGLTLTGDTKENINIDNLPSWDAQLLNDPKNRLAQNAYAKGAIKDIVYHGNPIDKYLFNITVGVIGLPKYLDNQALSGRCWIFATANVLRTEVIRKYNLKDDTFQLSQGYLYFYDKLEKANFFLDNIIDTADSEKLDSRLTSYLLSGPVGDGGQWDMIINLVNKYGLVPNELFPDNAQTAATSTLNYVLTEKLREFALILRKLISKGVSASIIKQTKNAMNKQVYNIIALALGSPPKPDDKFVWEFIDKDGKYKHFETTPKDFYKDHVSVDVNDYFSLIHDPRNPYKKLYTVDRLNNISEGKPIEYVNLEINDLKRAAIKMLKDDKPIFFGCDVGKFSDSKTGILDTSAFDYELGFGTGFHLSKTERLQTGSSQMTHAMVLTGVHLDPLTGLPSRWKIENSWGGEVGDGGYFLMTDQWFDEYVLQIVTLKKYVDRDVYEVFKGKDFTVLPFYDPMGALA